MLTCSTCKPQSLSGHVLVHLSRRPVSKTSRGGQFRRMATDAEEANLAARGFHRYTSKKYEKVGGVLEVEWVQSLMRQKDTSSVLTAGAMVSKDSLLPIDHMVRVNGHLSRARHALLLPSFPNFLHTSLASLLSCLSPSSIKKLFHHVDLCQVAELLWKCSSQPS